MQVVVFHEKIFLQCSIFDFSHNVTLILGNIVSFWIQLEQIKEKDFEPFLPHKMSLQSKFSKEPQT